MSDEDAYMQKLNELKAILEKDVKYNGKITECLGALSIELPMSASNLFSNASLINKDYPFAFLGYEALGEEAIFHNYENANGSTSFFGRYGVDRNYNVAEDMCIALQETYDEELDDSIEITNIGVLLPLLEFQGDYIVIDLDKESFGRVLVVTDGHLGSILAPSILDHISDLIEGLNERIYKISDDELVYPSSWYQRKKVRSGDFEMDEDGEII